MLSFIHYPSEEALKGGNRVHKCILMICSINIMIYIKGCLSTLILVHIRWHLIWYLKHHSAPISHSAPTSNPLMLILRECLSPVRSAEFLAKAWFVHHGFKRHRSLKHYAGLKGLDRTPCSHPVQPEAVRANLVPKSNSPGVYLENFLDCRWDISNFLIAYTWVWIWPEIGRMVIILTKGVFIPALIQLH